MNDATTPDNYLTATPFGMVDALFGEAPGCELRGPADAVAHIKRVMVGCTNADGMSMSVETVEPADYFNFCQPEGCGILIVEPVDVALDPMMRGDGADAAALDGVDGDIDDLQAKLAAAADSEAKLKIARAIQAARQSAGPAGLPADPAAEWAALLTAADGDATAAGKAYLKLLQGATVQTVIGPVFITGKTAEKMRSFLKNNDLKASLIPRVPEILQGEYLGAAVSDKPRSDGFTAFHYFAKTLTVGELSVTAGVSVGEGARGKVLTAYDLASRMYGLWAERTKGTPLSPGHLSREGVPSAASKLDDALSMPTLAGAVNGEAEGLNIVILQVLDADGNRVTELEDAVQQHSTTQTDVTLDPLAGGNADRLDEVGGPGRTPTAATKGSVNLFKEGDKVVSLDTSADLVVTRQDGFRVYVKGRADWLHANRLKLASGKAPERRVMDDCGEDEDGEEFDAEAEFDACDKDASEKLDGIVLDGDFRGHPFRGNGAVSASGESRTAAVSSRKAKRAEMNGDAKAAKSAHRAAHYSHMAAAEGAKGTTRKYHRTMAKFHGGRAGVRLDSVALDAVSDLPGLRTQFASAAGALAKLAAARAIQAARASAAADDGPVVWPSVGSGDRVTATLASSGAKVVGKINSIDREAPPGPGRYAMQDPGWVATILPDGATETVKIHSSNGDRLELTPNAVFNFASASAEARALLAVGADNPAPRSTYKAAVEVETVIAELGMAVHWEASDALPVFDDAGAYLGKDKTAIAATASLLKYLRAFVRSESTMAKNPLHDGFVSKFGFALEPVINKEQAQAMLTKLIDVAVSRKGGEADLTDAQWRALQDYQRDARVIAEYFDQRMHRHGGRNQLRTPEMKARYPEIDNPDDFPEYAKRGGRDRMDGASDAAREAYLNYFHKIAATVSFDEWRPKWEAWVARGKTGKILDGVADIFDRAVAGAARIGVAVGAMRLDSVDAAIASLNMALGAVETNESINRAAGNIAKADMEVENAAQFRCAIALMRGARLDDAAGGLFGTGDRGYINGAITDAGRPVGTVYLREDGMVAFQVDDAISGNPSAIGFETTDTLRDVIQTGWREDWRTALLELKDSGYGEVEDQTGQPGAIDAHVMDQGNTRWKLTVSEAIGKGKTGALGVLVSGAETFPVKVALKNTNRARYYVELYRGSVKADSIPFPQVTGSMTLAEVASQFIGYTNIDSETPVDIAPPGYVAEAKPKPTPTPAPGRFRYALVNRPADLGTIPRGLEYELEPRPAPGEPHYDMARHGILVTKRELTPEELKNFELAPLIDGAMYDVLAAKIAESMGEYAAQYVRMEQEDPVRFYSKVTDVAKRPASGIRYSIGDSDALGDRVLALLEDMVKASGPSAQFEAYAKAINAGQFNAGMADQIRADERLEDGEAEKLLALVAAVTPAPKPEPVPPPLPQPQPAPANAPRAAALALLTEVASGKHAQMLEPELADQIEAALMQFPDDGEVQAAGEQAIVAYSNGLLAAT
jgi:hypothetical protein